jgi:hypothetical protein
MLTLLFSLRDCFRARAVLQAEILALRHQLLVLQRSRRDQRLSLRWTDRVLWVWLSRLWNDWRSALLIVKPETVIAWHRKGFRLYWRWKSRRRDGRPTASPEVRNLIRQMSLANPRWGTPRIHGELLKIGIEVSQATVAKYMVRKSKGVNGVVVWSGGVARSYHAFTEDDGAHGPSQVRLTRSRSSVQTEYRGDAAAPYQGT